MGDVLEQLEVLNNFAFRLEKIGIPYMLTGSMALSHYAIPRSTVDIDIVIAINAEMLLEFLDEFSNDFYIPVGSAREAVGKAGMFNAIHNETLIKVDCILPKTDEFGRTAFLRKQKVTYAGEYEIWIISREDLILSKLIWSKKSGSDRQLTDAASILKSEFDSNYVGHWVELLGLRYEFNECKKKAEIRNGD